MGTFKKTIIGFSIIGSWLLWTGCTGPYGKSSNCDIIRRDELKEIIHPYEIATFYKVDFKRDEYVPVKEVSYYVNGDTLFTSEPYRSFCMFFSDMEKDSIVNMNYVAFDLTQKPNEDGWYLISLGNYKNNPKDYHRLPNTRLSAVVLRAYFNGMPDTMFSPSANAVLYNGTKTMAQSRERNKLDRQLKKLLPYID